MIQGTNDGSKTSKKLYTDWYDKAEIIADVCIKRPENLG